MRFLERSIRSRNMTSCKMDCSSIRRRMELKFGRFKGKSRGHHAIQRRRLHEKKMHEAFFGSSGVTNKKIVTHPLRPSRPFYFFVLWPMLLAAVPTCLLSLDLGHVLLTLLLGCAVRLVWLLVVEAEEGGLPASLLRHLSIAVVLVAVLVVDVVAALALLLLLPPLHQIMTRQ